MRDFPRMVQIGTCHAEQILVDERLMDEDGDAFISSPEVYWIVALFKQMVPWSPTAQSEIYRTIHGVRFYVIWSGRSTIQMVPVERG